jgi:Domain of unknown function (DUF4340)
MVDGGWLARLRFLRRHCRLDAPQEVKMRFKGTLLLLLICAGLGAFVYYYEIRGGEQREKAKQEEKQLWKLESNNIQQIDLIVPDQQVTAVRTGEKEWKLTAPRALEADSDELNRLASSAADMSRESVIEPNASDLSKFGLNPAEVTLHFKMKDGTERKIRFGQNNPTGSSTYAVLDGKNEVFLVPAYVASTFKKKLIDLRNRSILKFEQFETQTVDLQTQKGAVRLVKEGDRWWIQGKERWAADSSAVSGLLSALATTQVKDFLEEKAADSYGSLGFDKPLLDVKLTVGKDKGIKHLTIGMEKSKLTKTGESKPKPKPEKKDDTTATAASELYVARDESRTELFLVDKEFVDKIAKEPKDFRDKALASFQRWDIDVVFLKNSKGEFTFTKSGTSGDWVMGDAKKKTKWDGVSGILDAMEKPVKEFVENSGAASSYGLDKPEVRVILKQGANVKVDCVFGKETREGVYAQIKGESSIKIADKESIEKLNKGETDFLEAPPPATTEQSPQTPATKK